MDTCYENERRIWLRNRKFLFLLKLVLLKIDLIGKSRIDQSVTIFEHWTFEHYSVHQKELFAEWPSNTLSVRFSVYFSSKYIAAEPKNGYRTHGRRRRNNQVDTSLGWPGICGIAWPRLILYIALHLKRRTSPAHAHLGWTRRRRPIYLPVSIVVRFHKRVVRIEPGLKFIQVFYPSRRNNGAYEAVWSLIRQGLLTGSQSWERAIPGRRRRSFRMVLVWGMWAWFSMIPDKLGAHKSTGNFRWAIICFLRPYSSDLFLSMMSQNRWWSTSRSHFRTQSPWIPHSPSGPSPNDHRYRSWSHQARGTRPYSAKWHTIPRESAYRRPLAICL